MKILTLFFLLLILGEQALCAKNLEIYFKSIEQSNDGLLIQMPDKGTRYLLYQKNEEPKLLEYNQTIAIEYGKRYSFRTRHLQINFKSEHASGSSFEADLIEDFRSFGGELEVSSVLIELETKGRKGLISGSSAIGVIEIPPAPPVEEVAEVIEEITAPEPAIEEPAEVIVAEPVEEDVEQSPNWPAWLENWWLCLIGAVIIVGGILMIRRKK